MKKLILQLLFSALLLIVFAPSSLPQSQALNGQIEGTISDQTGAALPNVVVTAANVETGANRFAQTDESGVYHFPLLPLGVYRVTAEAANFKKFVREGVTLTIGQTATVDFKLETGEVRETVTVSADTAIADAGKTDLGRVMNARETQNLPLIQRNPYNFAFLQTNVNGRPSRGFGFPAVNANGYLRRVNYLMDGNTNTQNDRASVRLMIISETFVSEVQLLTNGFAAEFGNTTGIIMNVVTPAGTNKISGSASYRFRRPSFYSRPFFYNSPEDVPDNTANIFTAAVGAPVIRDRWHFYFGYEWQSRDTKASADRLVTITPANRTALINAGLSPAIFPPAIPTTEKGAFYIFRSDLQLNEGNRLTGRFNHSDVGGKNQIPGGLNTLERSTDSMSISDALAVQLNSYTPKILNEFRFQYAQRRATNTFGIRNEFSGSRPSVTIIGVANFGAPAADDSLPPMRVTQFQNNLTRTTGSHVFKFGGGFNFYNHTERSAIVSGYTFATLQDYLDARRGARPRSYSRYEQTFGDPIINYRATFYNFFAQDDWKLSRRLKINYGVRYDLYLIPKADATSPFAASQKFNVDKNNFAPRLGVVYAFREGKRPTIIRFGAGIYYDLPLLATYRRAVQNNGNPRFFSVSFEPSALGAPNFPNTFSGTAPTQRTQDIDAISPDFVNMYAIHSNVQIEQALTENLSLAVGYVRSAGRHIPVYRNINAANPTRFLADGRPVFGGRRDTRFNVIQMAESAGNSNYNALTLQINKRFSRGLQFSANYTFSKATDDAPEQNVSIGSLSLQGSVLSDPTKSPPRQRQFVRRPTPYFCVERGLPPAV